ncbi:unnamed protein product [Prorocentrum cordatum]|uniref:Anaphase-promoting complex subunit 4-like WD40 domain-containing protein n=1 Tax=Prorocentrum cordatum TaxID=2364126 RepID=A0ABN9VLG7_9DINO|nr:unnamed protein product [Polarella glacialis]
MAGDAPSPRPCSFQVQSDRSASDLEAFEWNPSMDLLACLTTPPDSSMVVYRLLSEDQSPKLLSEKITGIGSALAWSPCGRRIAVGDCLGGVSIYDGESGAVLRSSRLHTRPVVALSWVSAETAGGQAAVPSWPLALPPLLPVPSAPSNMYACALDADPEAVPSRCRPCRCSRSRRQCRRRCGWAARARHRRRPCRPRPR